VGQLTDVLSHIIIQGEAHVMFEKEGVSAAHLSVCSFLVGLSAPVKVPRKFAMYLSLRRLWF